jgi:hypothetical protein
VGFSQVFLNSPRLTWSMCLRAVAGSIMRRRFANDKDMRLWLWLSWTDADLDGLAVKLASFCSFDGFARSR